MSRAWPQSDEPTRTIGLISDAHAGSILSGRYAKAGRSLRDDPHRPQVAAWVDLGDLVQAPSAAMDTTALTWISTYLSPTPVYKVGGNHDVDGAFGGTARTGEQAAVAHGMASRDWTVDLGFVRLIGLGCEISGGVGVLDAASLTYLDAALTAAGDQACFVASHFPLYNTVGAGGPSTEYKSTDAAFYYPSDNAIRAVLADHDNAKAWLSGHTHSPIDANNFAAGITVGSHILAAITCSSLEYIGNVSRDPSHPMIVTVITYPSTGAERIEVRFRDLGAGIWTGRSGGTEKVLTVLL